MPRREKSYDQQGPHSLTISPMKLSRSVLLVLLVALGFGLVKFARSSKASAIPRARLSQTISVHASGRGNPSINLNDGRDVLTSYLGPAALAQALQRNEAEPLALASADFDEDGVPDLICGYAHSISGIITRLRGNVDSIYENSPEAQRRKATGEFTDAPFLSPARVFALPIEPEFLGAGDFDGDGHWDIVAASRTSDALYLLPGDGRGGFGEAKRVALPGTVTALVTGEINRRDGLDDVVVAVNGQHGPKALVFEGPEGALKAKPETFDLQAEASALALGQLDDDYPIDLAIAAGRELMIVHGRDRKLSLDEKSRAEVPQASISRRALPFTVRSLAIGDFSGNNRNDVALLSDDGAIHLQSRNKQEERSSEQTDGLHDWSSSRLPSGEWPHAHHLICARVSGSANDDLLVVDSASRQLHIVVGKPLNTGTVAESPILTEGILQRTVSLDVEGEPTAVLPMRLNSDARRSLVVLNGSHGSPSVLLPQASMTYTVTKTNDAGDGSLRQAILDANGNPGTDTIRFNIPGSGVHTIALATALPRIIDPVIIDGTTQPGFAGSPIIELDGTNATVPDRFGGFQIVVGNNTVRGLVMNRFPWDGIVMAGTGANTVIEGNFIGTDAGGTKALGNGLTGPGAGVVVAGANNTGSRNNIIGGTTPSARNIVSGNRYHGVIIGGPENRVQGNFIGTDVSGSINIGNFYSGVVAPSGLNNLIGGTTQGTRNIISGHENQSGVFLDTGKGNLVQGNFIGTDVTGSSIVPNGYGALITGPNIDNTIGGTAVGAANVISGNTQAGVLLLENGASADKIGGNQIQDNYIGTDLTGTVAMGNRGEGIVVSGEGSTLIQDNIISSNLKYGVSLGGYSTDPNTKKPVFGGTGTTVKGNFIGTDKTGRNLGNKLDGIFVENTSFLHTIEENTIAFNLRNGVRIPNSSSNTNIPGRPAVQILIGSNSIYGNGAPGNGALGIDLGELGVTANHIKDPNKLEANEGQNFPELSNVTNDGTNITIQGRLQKSAPNTKFTIEFFSNTGCVRQGQHPIKTLQIIRVKTDANGTAIINVVLPVAMAGGFINATARDPVGNTSEFSDCAQMSVGHPPEVIAITVTSTIVAIGSGFDEQVRVFIDGIGFPDDQPARVKGGGTRVIQKGKLTDGRSIAEAVPPGRVVKIKFRNANGGETEVSFRN